VFLQKCVVSDVSCVLTKVSYDVAEESCCFTSESCVVMCHIRCHVLHKSVLCYVSHKVSCVTQVSWV